MVWRNESVSVDCKEHISNMEQPHKTFQTKKKITTQNQSTESALASNFLWEGLLLVTPLLFQGRSVSVMDTAGRGCSWTSRLVDSNGDGALFSKFVWSFRLLSLIKQTFVVICKGGRCAGDTCTAGEVISLAAGRAC